MPFYLDKYKHEKLGMNCSATCADSDKPDVINVPSNMWGIMKINAIPVATLGDLASVVITKTKTTAVRKKNVGLINMKIINIYSIFQNTLFVSLPDS
jgi:hypothetical protein